MALGLGASVKNNGELRLRDYTDADGGTHPRISDIPFIILSGGSGQIQNLRKAAIESGLDFMDFGSKIRFSMKAILISGILPFTDFFGVPLKSRFHQFARFRVSLDEFRLEGIK